MKQKSKGKKQRDIKKVPLGTKLRDTITGYEGVAIAKTVYMNGCVQFHLKSNIIKDGKTAMAEPFDSQQLETVEKPKKEIKKKPTGGIMPDQVNVS